MRDYERQRRPRTARVQRAARRNDASIISAGPAAVVRDAALAPLGGELLLAHMIGSIGGADPCNGTALSTQR